MPILTREQKQRFEDDGYLVVPDFYTQQETAEMLNQAHKLLDEFDIAGHPMTTFRTSADGDHVGDDYFLNSGDKIRYFLEPSSLSPATPDSPAKLLVEASRSINKIGHALAVLDPVFRKHTFESDKIRTVAQDLQVHKSPRVLQSMVICKQPKIGGTVPCHNDSTFLYTDPPSAIGAWVALEACTSENGCLSFLPGSHKKVMVSSRFVRDPSGKGTTFVPIEGVENDGVDWDKVDGWVPAPVSPGTLVLIHGSVMHRSPPNPSEKSRVIYTFHMIEGADGYTYDEKNWLQPTPEMPFKALF